MANYFRFLFCATAGLLGLGIVLTFLIDRVFYDWDFLSDMARVFRFAKDRGHLWRLVEREERLMDREGTRLRIAPRYVDVWTDPLPDLSAVYGPLESRAETADPETIVPYA